MPSGVYARKRKIHLIMVIDARDVPQMLLTPGRSRVESVGPEKEDLQILIVLSHTLQIETYKHQA